jgi:hypothetical protein
MGANEEAMLAAAETVLGEKKPEEIGKLEWIWLALQGDFNEERTAGQIGFDMAVSLIPFVDTVCDIRDLVANLKAYKKEPDNKLRLFFIVLTIIGFIPEIGSLVKGVVKIVFVYLRNYIRRIDDILNISKLTRAMDRVLDSALPKITEYLQSSVVVRWATDNKVVNLLKYVADELNKIIPLISASKLKGALNKGLDEVVDKLKWVYHVLPSKPRSYVEAALDVIDKYRTKLLEGIDMFVEPVRVIMIRITLRLEAHARNAALSTVNRHWIGPVTEGSVARLLNSGAPPKWAKQITTPMPHPPYNRQAAGGLETMLKDYQAYIKARKQALDVGNPPPPSTVDPEWLKHDNLPGIGAGTFQTFERGLMRTVHYPPGTRLYRVVDETNDGAGQFWVTEEVFLKIKNREQWRSGSAIKPDWNQNGKYVVYTVPEGGLDAFVGPAASQELKGTNYMLEGGVEQVVFNPGVRDTVKYVPMRDQAGEYVTDVKIRQQINDPNIKGPFETGWGYNGDFTQPPTANLLIELPVPDDIQ